MVDKAPSRLNTPNLGALGAGGRNRHDHAGLTEQSRR
jgi:hypothetical protein